MNFYNDRRENSMPTVTVMAECGRIAKHTRGRTPLYGLYRYVQPQRVGFFRRFGHK